MLQAAGAAGLLPSELWGLTSLYSRRQRIDHDARFLHAVEELPVEQLVPEPAVEALAVDGFPRTARLDGQRVGADPL